MTHGFFDSSVVGPHTEVVLFNTRRKVIALGQGPAHEAICRVIERVGACGAASPTLRNAIASEPRLTMMSL